MKPIRPFAVSLGAALWLIRAAILPALSAEPNATFKVSEFSFNRPSGWQWVESSSPMRKAQLKIPDPENKQAAEVVFFHFGPGAGGDTKANIDRWLSQFEEPREKIQAKVDEVTVNKRKITYVQAQGTYLSGMPGGSKTPQPNSMLLGAILESPQGSVFVRLTGPQRLTSAVQGSFRKMIEDASK